MDISIPLKHLHNIEKELTSTISKTLDTLATIAQTNAQSSKFFKGSGPNGLRANIKILKNGEMSRTVLADKNYAGYVEFGNNPGGDGFIRPVNAKYLHFWINGKEIFAKKVRSHGPLPFMKTAQIITEQFIPDIFNTAIQRLINRS